MVKLKTPDYWQFDKRSLIQDKGENKLSEKQLKEHLKSLPDDAANVDTIPIWSNEATLPSQKLSQKVDISKVQAPNKILSESPSEDENLDSESLSKLTDHARA